MPTVEEMKLKTNINLSNNTALSVDAFRYPSSDARFGGRRNLVQELSSPHSNTGLNVNNGIYSVDWAWINASMTTS